MPSERGMDVPIGILLKGPHLDPNGRTLGVLRKVGVACHQSAILIRHDSKASWKLCSPMRNDQRTQQVGMFEISKIAAFVDVLISQLEITDNSDPREFIDINPHLLSSIQLRHEPGWLEKWKLSLSTCP